MGYIYYIYINIIPTKFAAYGQFVFVCTWIRHVVKNDPVPT